MHEASLERSAPSALRGCAPADVLDKPLAYAADRIQLRRLPYGSASHSRRRLGSRIAPSHSARHRRGEVRRCHSAHSPLLRLRPCDDGSHRARPFRSFAAPAAPRPPNDGPTPAARHPLHMAAAGSAVLPYSRRDAHQRREDSSGGMDGQRQESLFVEEHPLLRGAHAVARRRLRVAAGGHHKAAGAAHQAH